MKSMYGSSDLTTAWPLSVVAGFVAEPRRQTTLAPVLPGGRNSGQKAQKGPQKKKVGRKNLWPNFG
jgi:hypothetical protein